MYIKNYDYKGRNIRYLCIKVDNVEIVLGWLDNFNNLHSK